MGPHRTSPGGQVHGQEKGLRRGVRGRPQGHGGARDRLAPGSDSAFTAAVFIKYAAIVIVVLVIAYMALRIVSAIQGTF
ncbi:MAG TPA: hypothetical protein VFI90_11665 [Rubrobacter sp.]|nr:hypothetical protein [Rubrobacter sp.]